MIRKNEVLIKMLKGSTKPFEIDSFLIVRDGKLFIGDYPAKDLAHRFGTPLFIFSEQRIKDNIARLRKIQNSVDSEVKICYAAKANSLFAILRTVRNSNCDIEVNSGGELWKAIKVGFSGDQIIFNGTSKEEWEIELAINHGIYAIQVDSLYELSLIEKAAERLGKRANVSLRLVPEIKTSTHSGLQTALLTSKFGMTSEEALWAFQHYASSAYLRLSGIHVHIGSQNPDKEAYTEAMMSLFQHVFKIYEKFGLQLGHVNLGGGFPVNYLRDKSHAEYMPDHIKNMFSADFEPADAIAQAWKFTKASFPQLSQLSKKITLVFEPGRSIIADAGICLTTIRNKKCRPLQEAQHEQLISKESLTPETSCMTSRTQNPPTEDVWLLTDAGFNILLSMETYKWYYHIVHAERTDEPHCFPYKLAGPLCDGGDVYFDIEQKGRLPDYRLLPANTQPGEVLAILNCGAYSIAQMFPYNGRFLPAVLLLDNLGQIRLIRHRDSFENLLQGEVIDAE